MRMFDFEALLNSIDDDLYTKFFLDNNETTLSKEEMIADFRELEKEFHSHSFYDGDSYTAFADGIDVYLSTLFPIEKEAEPYREKAYRIIDEIKAGETSLDKLEDLVKIFVSVMGCCSEWLTEDHDQPTPITADSEYEFAVYPEDMELLNKFADLDIQIEYPGKGFLWMSKKELFDKEQQELIFIITTYLMIRLFQFEGLFIEEESLYE